MENRGSNEITRQYFEHPPRSHLYRCPAAHGRPDTRSPSSISVEMVSRDSALGSPQGQQEKNTVEGRPASDGEMSPPRKTLSTLFLVGLMYTFTMSGAYGIEESVMGGGAILTVASIVVMPLIMGIPTALVVAELASCVPSNAGFLMWIHLSFHRIIYLSMGLLSLFYIFVDNALYPTLFSDYCCTVISCSKGVKVGLRLSMLVVTLVLNLLGIETVGIATVLLTVLTVLPFVLLFLQQQLSSGFYINWQALAYIPASIDWATFISTASWNLSGLEQAGSVVEEVPNPQRTIIGSLIPLMGLAFLTYIPPIISGVSATNQQIDLSAWTMGYWADVSSQVGGPGLKAIMVLGSILSAFGLTLSALCTTTRIISGMALTEAFPEWIGKWLSARNERFGSYHWSLILNTGLSALFSCVLDFGPLVLIDQCLYGIRVIVILIAFYRFRHLYPCLERPFRIPFSGWKLHCVMGVAFISFAALTVISMVNADSPIIWCAVIIGSSVVVSAVYCFFFHKGDFLGRIVTETESVAESEQTQ